jgi:2-polyprenyl-3-methyl-5-hydroxy-6-metoxy-1,4-benzoquinol methylase
MTWAHSVSLCRTVQALGAKSKMLDKLTGQKMVCPWWLCFIFDNPIRKLLHNPETILSPYVRPGNTVIDIGAGMGYFSIPLARLVGPTGHVIAIDVQAKMLSALANRARRYGVSERIKPHLANSDSLGTHPSADFVMAFWMVHEVPNPRAFFKEILGFMKSDGLFLLVEPILHVRKKDFLRTIQTANEIGFIVKDMPKIRISRSALFTHSGNGL